MMNESIVSIDQHRLDQESVIQPDLVYKYGKLLAKAKERFATAKANVDVVEAQVEEDIRNNPKEYSLATPVRENAIKGKVLLSPKYQKAIRLRIAAQRKLDNLDAVVSALEHRKKALEGLIYLWGASYFASPRIKGDSEQQHESKKNRVKNKMEKYKPSN